VTILDQVTALVVEQHVYDSRGMLLASAALSKHMLDQATGAKLPRHINIQWPPAKLEFAIDMADIEVNRLPADPQELFKKPTYSGYNDIDLAQPGLQLTPAPSGQYQAAPEARY
jgi:hypothetical protein